MPQILDSADNPFHVSPYSHFHALTLIIQCTCENEIYTAGTVLAGMPRDVLLVSQ